MPAIAAHSMIDRGAIGFVASALVSAAFGMKDMVSLRIIAICSNVAFITYAVMLNLPPILILQVTLLPLNGWRLVQELQRRMVRSPTKDSKPADSVVALGLAMFAGAAISATAVKELQAQQTARGAYETPIWKTITLGTYRNANVLRDALDSVHCRIEEVTSVKVGGRAFPTSPIYDNGSTTPSCHLEGLANEIIGRPAFALSRTKTEVDLVVFSVSELGFGNQGASLKDIYARAKSLGFALCPPEVGPQLRLQYLEQPSGEVLHIAMEPIAKYDGDRVSLSLENGNWGLVLFGYYVAAVEMYPRALFVFVKPRYGDSRN